MLYVIETLQCDSEVYWSKRNRNIQEEPKALLSDEWQVMITSTTRHIEAKSDHCDHCGYTSSYWSHLNKHKKENTKRNSIVISVTLQVPSGSNLNLHKKNEHQKTFPCRDSKRSEFCDKCATELRTGAQLEKHFSPLQTSWSSIRILLLLLLLLQVFTYTLSNSRRALWTL